MDESVADRTGGPFRRRRRSRPRFAATDDPAGGEETDSVDREGPGPPRARDRETDRSLRALVSIRGTQVPPTIALRAREADMPTAAELAQADADLVIVRRHYVPPTPLQTGRRPDDRTDRTGRTRRSRSNPPAEDHRSPDDQG